jgi:hypothetical protein
MVQILLPPSGPAFKLDPATLQPFKMSSKCVGLINMIMARNVNIKEEHSIWQQRTVQLQLNNSFGVESFIGKNDREKDLFLNLATLHPFKFRQKRKF